MLPYESCVCFDVKHKLTWRFMHATSALPRGTLARTSSRGVRYGHPLGDGPGGYTSPPWHQMSWLYQLLINQNKNGAIPMSYGSDSKIQCLAPPNPVSWGVRRACYLPNGCDSAPWPRSQNAQSTIFIPCRGISKRFPYGV